MSGRLFHSGQQRHPLPLAHYRNVPFQRPLPRQTVAATRDAVNRLRDQADFTTVRLQRSWNVIQAAIAILLHSLGDDDDMQQLQPRQAPPCCLPRALAHELVTPDLAATLAGTAATRVRAQDYVVRAGAVQQRL